MGQAAAGPVAYPTTSAVSSTAWNSTSVPAAAQSGEISSASLWRQPAHAGAHDHHRGRHAVDPAGVVAGAADDIHVGIAQPLRRRRARVFTSPGSKVTGSKCPTSSIAKPRPSSAATAWRRAIHLASHRSSLPCSGDADIDREHHLARDHVARVREDLDLPHRAHGIRADGSSRSGARASVIRAMPSPAFTRIVIGVDPVWASLPVSVISSHHRPCPWVTTPMSLPSASRIGPCSMCSSSIACILRAPTGSSPTQPIRASSSPKPCRRGRRRP